MEPCFGDEHTNAWDNHFREPVLEMTLWKFVFGAAVILIVFGDVLTSTLSTRGAGPVTRAVIRAFVFVGRSAHRLTGSRTVLTSTGVASLIGTVLVWVILLWTGWLLLFSASPNAVVDATTLEPADVPSRIYFTGFTLLTLGVGDFIPQGPLFQILTACGSLTGLFLVTLAITYLVPVLSAAVDKRRIALSIQGMGETPAGIVKQAWNGSGFPGIEQLLASLSSEITLHGERHLAYPIVHYYYASDSGSSAPVRIAALDEAVTLLAHGVAPEARPSKTSLATARNAVTSYLNTLSSMYVSAADETPPVQDVETLRMAGIPTVDSASFERATAHLEPRRRLLRANVRSSGWSWSDVVTRGEPLSIEVD